MFSSTVGPTLAAITYTYDANGNQTSDGKECYHYNEANQMDKVTNCSNGQTIAEYVYDYNGKRIVKREFENGVLKKTVYSPNDEFEKTIITSNSAVQDTTYYKVNDETIAKKDASGNKTYFHNDHLGSNNVSTNQSGVVVEETTYEPYGEVKAGGTKSKFQYTGQEKDGETGLNYYDSRYYDPHIQRFIQPDTWLPNIYDPQQLNRYSYANNNPLRYTDPSGHSIWSVVAGAVRWALGTSVGRQVVKAAAALPVVRDVVAKVSGNQQVQQVQKVVQPVVNAVKSSPAAMKTINNVDTVQAGAKQNQQMFKSASTITQKSLNFASQAKLQDHFGRHARGLGFKSPTEYLDGARNLFKGGKGVDAALRSDGDAIFYRETTKEFGILSPDNIIRTYLAPRTGLRYFESVISK